MLLRLYLLCRPAASPSPTHNHAPILCDELIRRGRKPWQRYEGNQRGRQLVPLLRLLPSLRQPPASSLQPPASPLTRATRSHRQALRTVQPTSHPSGERQAATSPAALRPMRWTIQCERQPQNPPAATLKVINTYVDNLLITC